MPAEPPPRRIAVIGGGPGGAHCAFRLAQAGARVTLFEPRRGFEKPCGGGIPARALELYPFLDDPALPVKRVDRCLLVSPAGREAEITLREPLHMFSRADLHTFMLRRAVDSGAQLVTSKVVACEPADKRTWTIRAIPAGSSASPTHERFDFVVAADGAAGAVRRKLAGPFPAPLLTQGIGYYMPGLSEDRITLKFCRGLDGYLWVFPRPGHSSAGICGGLGKRSAAELKRLMDDYLIARYGRDLVAGSERYAALIPAARRSVRAASVQGDGWALVGDSGASVDPLTREGIFYAMLSGDLLAEALLAGRADTYQLAWRREFGRDLAVAARYSGGFYGGRFIEKMVAMCALSPAVGSVMADLIGGRQPYRSLKLRLIMNGPRVAWQLTRRRAWRYRGARGPYGGDWSLTASRGSRNSGR